MPKSTIGENPLRFPIPSRHDLGTVTVLCGANGSGKSYILRNLKNLLEGRQAGQFQQSHGWSLDIAPSGPGTIHRPHHHTVQMTSIGSLGITRAGKEVSEDDTDLRVQVGLFGALLQALRSIQDFDAERWQADGDYRKEAMRTLGPVDEERVFWLEANTPAFMALFRDAFGCRIGVRRAPTSLELVLGLPNGVTAPFASWSEGQKSFFTVLAVTFVLKPDIYIFDEVENFLHPELISRLLDHLKRNCRQTVLSSHHPHLIFGNLVDAVFYVEALDPPQAGYAERAVKYQQQPSAPRKIIRLESDTAKLASAYRLFDVRDAALLASSSLAAGAVELHLHDAVRGLYTCAAVAAGRGSYMDRQSEEIASFIASFDPQPRRVIDWGAGLGRSLDELSKRVPAVCDGTLEWVLYEPDPAARAELKVKHTAAGLNVTVVADRSDLAKIDAGLLLLTNVLHVLDPRQWRDALVDACMIAAQAENGMVLATEIYPLLLPEKEAVPVPPEWLESVFKALGFRTLRRHFAIQGCSSYCIAATRPPQTLPNENQILEVVVQHWRNLQTHYLDVYDGLMQVKSLADRKQLLNATFGLARVSSCLREMKHNGSD